MSSDAGRPLFIDSCAVNRFALLNVDPTKALAGSSFHVAYTAALAAEYRQALGHRYVEPHIKALLARLLQHGVQWTAPGSASGETDDQLVSLSARAFVVTLDRKPPWDRARDHPGLIVWPELEAALRSGRTLPDILATRSFDRGP